MNMHLKGSSINLRSLEVEMARSRKKSVSAQFDRLIMAKPDSDRFLDFHKVEHPEGENVLLKAAAS